jgi:peptidoglycan/xylan/chitin deacetylase (PgdA/CDA1 family)
MNREKILLALILVLGFLLCSIPLNVHDIPLSWEGFYHLRIAENITEGQYFYDYGSFGPEGRIQIHPPVFHLFSAVLITAADGVTVARWTPPVLFCIIIGVWYLLTSSLYKKSVALLSSLFLLAIPAFVDLGSLFSPQGLSLIFVFLALFFFKKNPVLSGILGGFTLMTHFTAFFYFLLIVFGWSLLDPEKRNSAVKITSISLVTSLPYIVYFIYNFPSFQPVFGFPGLKYLFSKTTFFVPALALLGLRKDFFAISLGAGSILSFLQPTNFCYIAFPLAVFSAFFVENFFLHKKWAVATFVFIFWLCLIPSQEYMTKLQPAAAEYESFLWLKANSIHSIIASGWYQAPIIASVSERIPVLGFSFPEEERVEDMTLLYNGDERMLNKYDVSYVYFGAYEEYEYQSLNLELDKVYSGKGSFYKREPPLIYILVTIDVEPDLPPVLLSYNGMEEGLPIILQLLERYDIPATFFVLGETAETYPSEISALAATHEIGCHSMHHEDLRTLTVEEKEEEIHKATTILQELAGQITSFRAPGHSCDTDLITVLYENGYTVEASACREFSYPYRPSQENWLARGDMDFLRVPISHTPSYFYSPLVYPSSWVDAYLNALSAQHDRIKIIVIGLHPWEFVNLEAPGYESFTQACGKYTEDEFENLLQVFNARRVKFLTMRELYEMWEIIEEKFCPSLLNS